MPRIRTLKPEHKQHRKVGMLTDRQYRLWVGMVTEADDEGRLVADAAQLRALIFAYQPRITLHHVAEALETITATGLIRLYRDGDVLYAYFPSWREHQRLDRSHFLPSRLPAPSVEEHSESMTERGSVSEPATTPRQGSEGNLTTQGREGNHAPEDPVPGVTRNGHEPKTPTFETPASIARALDRMPLLGPALRDPSWWQSELRAHPQLDLASEALKAEAWCRSNPDRAPKKRARRFLHSWFDRAEAR